MLTKHALQVAAFEVGGALNDFVKASPLASAIRNKSKKISCHFLASKLFEGYWYLRSEGWPGESEVLTLT